MNITVTIHYRPDEAGDPTPSSLQDMTLDEFVAAEAAAGRTHAPDTVINAILVKGEYTFEIDDGEGTFGIVIYAALTAGERASWRIANGTRQLLVGYRHETTVIADLSDPSPSVDRCLAAIRSVPDLLAVRDALAALLRHPLLEFAVDDDPLLNGARAALSASMTPGSGNQ